MRNDLPMNAAPAAMAVLAASPEAAAFYRDVLLRLRSRDIPFVVGGAYAFAAYTGIERRTKDIDLFVRRDDWARIERAAADAAWRAELTHPHWLGKIRDRSDERSEFVDLIFRSANGLAEVDDGWFAHAQPAEVLGVEVLLAPVEETIQSKSFVMERERYDGADVAHLLHARAATLDWARLLSRYGPHWRVLLSHLVLFGYVYPTERALIPTWVMDRLTARLRDETHALPVDDPAVCRGTLLSREQYLHDVEREGYDDGRAAPHGALTPQDIASWTEQIPARAAQSEGDGPPVSAAQ